MGAFPGSQDFKGLRLDRPCPVQQRDLEHGRVGHLFLPSYQPSWMCMAQVCTKEAHLYTGVLERTHLWHRHTHMCTPDRP